jgi:hypothetical protein
MGNRSTIHAYQLCQLANGRPGWTAGDHHKRGQFSRRRLAFIKAMGTMELSPVLLRELRQAMAASKKKNVPASTSGATDEATTTPVQPSACKRKAAELSNECHG